MPPATPSAPRVPPRAAARLAVAALLASTVFAGTAAAQTGPSTTFSASVNATPTSGVVAGCTGLHACELPNATYTQAATSARTGAGVDLRAASSVVVDGSSHFSYSVIARGLYNDVLFTTGPASSVTFQVMLSGASTLSSPDLRSGGSLPAAYAVVNDHVRQHAHTVGSPDAMPLTLTFNLQPTGTTAILWHLSAVSYITRPADVTPGDPWSAWASADYMSTMSVDYASATFYSGRNGTGDDVTDEVTFSFASAPAVVPEPATWALLGTGLLALGAIGRARRTAG